jgi:hypothetical protein
MRISIIKTSKTRIVATAIAIFLVLSLSASMMLMPTAIAHTPAWQVPTYAFISCAPNPVGVDQTVAVYMWIDKVIDGASPSNDIRFHGYSLSITAPDGTITNQTFATDSDPTSNQGTTFTPTQVGTYKLTFNFPQQVYTFTELIPNPFGFGPPAQSPYIGDTYLASTASTTLTVQQAQIPAAVTGYPLPTEYWTRPVSGQNTNWYTITSNYVDPNVAAFQFGAVRYVPGAPAPNSGHVMWTDPIQFGGIVGGIDTSTVNGAAFYTGLSYETRFSTPIIISGNLYFALPLSDSGTGGGYVDINLQTGKQVWRQNYAVNPSFGVLVDFESGNQHGVIPNGYLVAVDGSTWIAYDAFTGDWLFNITNVPSGTQARGPSGEVLIYQIDPINKWIAQWNFFNAIANGPLMTTYAGAYRPVGQIIDGGLQVDYDWNVTINALPPGAAIQWVIHGDMIFGSNIPGSPFGPGSQFGGVGNPSSATFWAVSLKPGSIGNLLWSKSIEAPPGNVTMQLGQADTTNRVFLFSTKETMQWYGYNLDNGNALWGPVGNPPAFSYYSTIGMGFSADQGYVAYGNFYVGAYGGVISCYNTLTGALQWTYGNDGEGNSTNSGLQTPWGLYPTFIGLIADGKVYVYNGEHSPNSPLYKGESITCLDATSGKMLWSLASWVSVGSFADERIPVADGYIAYFNSYDGQVYSIGKGPSQLTATAPDIASSAGTPVMIRGTLMDISAGTQQTQQKGDFPNGVPCVSDASMSQWMEYVYMQYPKPTTTTGVPVHLTAIDPNGNFQDMGTATSDSLGNYAISWTPPVPGTYKVTATFAGTESYFSSVAGTSFVVSAAPTPAPTPATTGMTNETLSMYIIGAAVAIIIVIVVVAALLLRKKP